MRLDKFLKVSRVIKRRPVAKTVIDNKKAKINGKVAKSGTEVKTGDILELEYFNRYFKIEIVDVPEGNIPKDKAQDLVKIIEVKELEIPEKEEIL